jgi:L-malate glycosyltransferase
LRSMGHRVDLITFRKDPDHDIGGIGLGADSKVSYLFKIAKFREIVAKLNPEILHTHYASSYGFIARFVKHPRKILSVWGDDIVIFPNRNFLTKIMLTQALRKSTYITATSKFLEKVTLEYITDKPIKIIPFGVDLDLFKYSERKPGEIVKIGIAKHLHPYYGVDILIRAIHHMDRKKQNFRLLIAGKGKYEQEYRSLVGELELDDIIEFVGPIEYPKMPDFLSSIDIAVMPSSTEAESFGVAAIEAAATGLPVVGTKVGGIPEVIEDGITGLMADKGDFKKIAQHLTRLIAEPDLRHKMGLAGRQMVEQRYSWQYCLESMQDLYYKMCS